MVEHRVLVDITHMNEKAIDHAFKLLDRPASHAGDRLAHRVPVRNAEYNLSDDVIREVGRARRRDGRDRLRALGLRRAAADAEDVRGERRRRSAQHIDRIRVA